ncbi:MAG: hypothetical protein B6242_04865 [Anaerolineaceae bacterium 4572_78]|nr:MAG: hypothetical protein B6242_04865 [Anaerolineaceae bacterium 4572_78]
MEFMFWLPLLIIIVVIIWVIYFVLRLFVYPSQEREEKAKRLQAEKQLYQIKSELKTLFKMLPDMYFRIDADGKILDYKKGKETDTHLMPTILLGKRVQDVFPHDVGQKIYDGIQHVLKTNTSFNLSYSLSSDDKEKHYEARMFPRSVDILSAQQNNEAIVVVRNITIHQDYQDSLAQSEERYRTLISNIQDGVFVINNARFEFVNDAFANMFGYTTEEVIGMPFIRLISPEDSDMVTNYHRRRLAGEDIPSNYEARFLHKDDKTCVFVNITAGVIILDGESSTIGTVKDITEHKKMDDSIRNQNMLFETLLQAIPNMVYYKDTEGRHIIVNRAAEKFMESSQDELIGKTSSGILSAHEAEYDWKTDQQAMNTGQTIHVENIHQKNGKTFYLDTLKVPIYNDENKPIGLVCVTRDVTELKKTESALHQNEERYRSLFENSPVSLWQEDFSMLKHHLDMLQAEGITDFETYFNEHPEQVLECVKLIQIVDVNDASLRLYEANSKDELLKGLASMVNQDTIDTFHDEIIALVNGDTFFRADVIIPTLKGNKKHTNISLFIPPGYEDTWEVVIVSSTDTTAQKKAEMELRRYQKELEDTYAHEIEIARQIQISLLPTTEPEIMGLEIASHAQTARQVGGDFYNYFVFDEKRLGIVVGDVSGKGIQAALFMALSVGSLSVNMHSQISTSNLLSELNNMLHSHAVRSKMNTALNYVILEHHDETDTWHLQTSNAGLIPPLIRHADGQVTWLEIGGLPLGIMENIEYLSLQQTLHPGDIIILSSDGVVESMNERGELYGFERLAQHVAHAPISSQAQDETTAHIMQKWILEDVYNFVGTAEQHDDITLVVIAVKFLD